MKIISLSAYEAGYACGIFASIKKYFYNNNCITDFFSYLEISLESINQLLLMDSNYIDDFLKKNVEIYNNKDNNYSVIFKNFDKMISHHDLVENDDYNFNILIDKYKRRYYRLINDINNEDKIFFIRYGFENPISINFFINLIKKLNPKLEFYFINLYYSNNINDQLYNYDNYIAINFYNYIDHDKIYNDNIFYKIMEYNWKPIYYTIRIKLDKKDKEIFLFNE